MNRRRKSISVEVDIRDSVTVDLDVDDIINGLDEDGIAKLRGAVGISTPAGFGEGDAAYTRNVITRAEMAARRMRDLPGELRDLFWHVHGVAL